MDLIRYESNIIQIRIDENTDKIIKKQQDLVKVKADWMEQQGKKVRNQEYEDQLSIINDLEQKIKELNELKKVTVTNLDK